MLQEELKNETIRSYTFLEGMYFDSYFPNVIVDKVKKVLLELCCKIEEQAPKDLDALYTLTHAATELINNLESDFDAADSEIETVAREVIAEDFDFIANTYNFDADVEELIAPRNW